MRIEPDEETSGPSELRIRNGTERDTVVRLVSRDSSRTARFVYIEASDEYTLTGIEPGNYALRFISGSEWVPACHDFLEADYFEFENALVFFEREAEDNRVKYNTIEVTLNPVPLGNARTRRIDKSRFFAGAQ